MSETTLRALDETQIGDFGASSHERTICHVSDTARWSAVFRARESERPDGVLRDPFARRLAGPRGEEIAASLPYHERFQWPWVIRTCLFDQLIFEQLRAGTDLVINLACGLDARPYRMDLPPSLTWVEVDFPELLAYKAEILKDEMPICALERVGMDLADEAARGPLLERLAHSCRRALVLSEGLLLYLSDAEVAGLAQDLGAHPTLRSWLVDIVSPVLLRSMQRNTHQQLGPSAATMKFAPPAGPGHFDPLGWHPTLVRSLRREAVRRQYLFSLIPAEDMTDEPSRLEEWQGVILLSRPDEEVSSSSGSPRQRGA